MSGVGRGKTSTGVIGCLCAVHNVRVWTEYVASGANLADLPTDLKLAE